MADASSANWRLQKAERFMTAAQRALEAGDFETAVSRAYYSAYHALIALLEAKGGIKRRRWDHDQVRFEFRARFASRGYLFASRDAEDMDKLYENRLEADYGRAIFSARRVASSIERTRAFHNRVFEVIGDA